MSAPGRRGWMWLNQQRNISASCAYCFIVLPLLRNEKHSHTWVVSPAVKHCKLLVEAIPFVFACNVRWAYEYVSGRDLRRIPTMRDIWGIWSHLIKGSFWKISSNYCNPRTSVRRWDLGFSYTHVVWILKRMQSESLTYQNMQE